MFQPLCEDDEFFGEEILRMGLTKSTIRLKSDSNIYVQIAWGSTHKEVEISIKPENLNSWSPLLLRKMSTNHDFPKLLQDLPSY